MRNSLFLAAVPALLLATASAGNASTIVQTIPGLTQDLGDDTPFDINALPFDAALGTLEDVTVEITGNYTPKTANDLGPFPATTNLTTRLFVFATNGGPTSNLVLGTQDDIAVIQADPQSASIA